MATFMCPLRLILAESEASTWSSHFVSANRVVQIKGKRRGITGSANRLSSVFPGRKLDEGTQHDTHTVTHTQHPSGWQPARRSSHSTHTQCWLARCISLKCTQASRHIWKVDFSLSESLCTCTPPSTHKHPEHRHMLGWVYPSVFDRRKRSCQSFAETLVNLRIYEEEGSKRSQLFLDLRPSN